MLMASLLCRAQVSVEPGTTVRLSRGTQLSLSNVSATVEGRLACDTSTVVGFGGKDAPRLQASQPLALHTLRLDGEAAIYAADLAVAGDVVVGGRGVARLSSSTTIRLQGSILGESEEGYITGGSIEKTLGPQPAPGRVATGMGLSFAAAEGYDSLRVTRRHEAWHSRGERSIAKVYELSRPALLSGAEASYLNAQSPKATDTYLLYRRTPLGLESVPSETSAAAKRVSSKGGEPFETDGLTVFPFPDLGFSRAVTPNGDGVNDCFEVSGIEKYPTARLVVLLPNGSVVCDVSPYGNRFCGDSLPTGTYYYMFFAEKDDRQPVKKGFFELVR
jgi:gliding motility-associated-like protein